VQLANFGQELSGTLDSLPGHFTSQIAIRDLRGVATGGKADRTIAEPSRNLVDEVHGTVFGITPDELAAADRYEVSGYARLQAPLKSGLLAWAYVRA
jgi:hypothetical protein